ncbi:B3/4 domain-containing protein [Russula vinacea]|nr:B3/4 domain-containing protein [Russula vinacea]
MPTVSVDKEDLWERLEQRFSSEEFDKLCFEFGIELDEDTTEEVETAIKQGLPAGRPIEIPANRYATRFIHVLWLLIVSLRYDLLCIEGIARALRVFLGKGKAPEYRLVYPPGGEKNLVEVTVAPETAQVRPYFGSAILRNVKFTQRSYESFIDLQEKLHQNICRKRQFVAIGTHDLDVLTTPFRYEAKPPKDIKFVPLNKTKAYTAEELMTVYESDRHLAKYLPIIRNSPVYPVIYDKEDRVLSFPPIINSEHTKITVNTRNIFIDLTATDQTKLNVVTNIMITMFSEYCEEPFTIEPVKIIYPDGRIVISPDLSSRKTQAHASYINSCTGLSLSRPQVKDLLERMSLRVELSPGDTDTLDVTIPQRATSTVAQPLAVSKLSDIIRHEWAYAGWVEVLPLILCSHEENFSWLRTTDDGQTAIKIANPKTLEFQYQAALTRGYYLKERNDPTFFPGRAATIYYRAGSTDAIRDGKDVEIGRLGILHPSVLEKFEIGYPCSALEFSLEPFKAKMPAMWTNDDI